MFDVAPTELLLAAVVALVVIGPKDLPKAMRVIGQWIARVRGIARHFRSGFDEMVRQAELDELEKKWAAENNRIMAAHPPEVDQAAEIAAAIEQAAKPVKESKGKLAATTSQTIPPVQSPSTEPELPFGPGGADKP